MGGPVVVDAAKKKVLKNVLGVAVFDVVEGSAIEALVSMTRFLNSRPKEFSSYEQAIQWRQVSYKFPIYNVCVKA